MTNSVQLFLKLAYLFSPFVFEGGGCRTVWLSSMSTTHFVCNSVSAEFRANLKKKFPDWRFYSATSQICSDL